MKKIKYIVIGIVIGIVIVGSLSVYAITAVIESKEVTYNNKVSGGRSEDVQGSIDELYERSGVMKEKWIDPILNGADPVFDNKGELIPVEIAGDGTVKYANLKTKWYEYEEKRWANAVILNSTGKGKNYKTGDKISESDIESYFVWIPRFKYKLWNLATGDGYVDLSQVENLNVETVREVTGKARLIDIQFGDTTEITKMSESEAKVGAYYTHPAFTAFGVNGLWVAKFEASGTTSAITVKPNMTPLLNKNVGGFWNAFYNYRRILDSHMMKNTEWGAVAYLSHSVYGIGTEVNINNNLPLKTGYSAAANTDQSSYPGTSGTTEDVTQAWNTLTGYLASTTGNITGVYDMSGGAWEYVAGYVDGYGIESSGGTASGLTATDLAKTQYFDKYDTTSDSYTFSKRILGDATGEMGQAYYYVDKIGSREHHNAWYGDTMKFVCSTQPWFDRGGGYDTGVLGGQFNFYYRFGNAEPLVSSRLVLAI